MMDTSDRKTIIGALCVASLAVLYFIITLISKSNGDSLKITQLYVYPVKGLRGCALSKAHIGPYGLVGDRTFCLQRVHRDDENDKTKKTFKTVFIGHNLELALFVSSIEHRGKSENAEEAEVVVTWKGQGTDFDVSKGKSNTKDAIRFPLKPQHQGSEELEVDMHTSKTKAYDMGDELSNWFTDRVGFEVRLVYIGDGSRPILGSLAPNSKAGLKRARLANRLRGMLPFLAHPAERLAFNDIAHYLVVTEESTNEVTSRLEDNCKMDVTKFRPNVVVKGASAPFVEDFWGEITFDGGIQMPLTANCYRCQSITVDYETGKMAADDTGTVWKKLNKDRRVDAGAKYSPVFGRYGYCFGSSAGKTLRVGQKGSVTRVNTQRTIFDWQLNAPTPDVSQNKK